MTLWKKSHECCFPQSLQLRQTRPSSHITRPMYLIQCR
jgi:hypothetical protein